MSIRRALAQADLAPIDAQVLLAHVVQKDRAWLVAHADDLLSTDQADVFLGLTRRRRSGEPIAYLTGVREFWGLPLRVSPAVLIPRHETETLVEVALGHLAAKTRARVLDFGTGSGAVALAIARERPHAHVVAADISRAALDVARHNARRLRIANVKFVQSDWYAGLGEDSDERFAAIVSNPPYVAATDAHLDEGDLRYEPPLALSAGVDGLASIRQIVAGAGERLAPGGLLAFEHGYDQAETVQALLRSAGFEVIATARDLAGLPRVTSGRRPS